MSDRFYGEWKFAGPYSDGSGAIYTGESPEKRDVTVMSFGKQGAPSDEVRALLLAAPDLLAALKMFVWPYQEGDRHTETERQLIGRGAIEAAGGEVVAQTLPADKKGHTETERLDWLLAHSDANFDRSMIGHWVTFWLTPSNSPDGVGGRFLAEGHNARACIDAVLDGDFVRID